MTTPPRRKIVHIVTKHIRDRYPRVLENDDVAEALGLTREQVRNCVRTYMTAHTDIVEDGPYRYVATSPNDRPTHAAVSGVPYASAPAPTIDHNVGCDFKLVRPLDDDHALLAGPQESVWLAERIKLQP